ncbi:MAG: P-II family nitrogen regulator [Bacteroidota bacterium]
MKKIEAVIRLSQFDAIRDALAKIGVKFFTLSEVKGFGLETEQKVYRGSVYDPGYIARLQVDIVCNDSKVDEIVETIVSSGRTGKVGDGKITVYSIDSVTRVRTGETGADAL